MNIFFTDADPVKCAIALDDKRVVKMVLESTQLLCTAINEHGGSAPYRSTHKNHPSAIWARESRANFQWLLDHGIALALEYTHRFGKIHKCIHVLMDIEEQDLVELMPEGGQTAFANCAAHKGLGLSFKHVEPTTDAYKEYLNQRWLTDKRVPKWTNRNAPKWKNLSNTNTTL